MATATPTVVARMTTGVTGMTTESTVTTSKVTTRVTTWDSMSACVRKTRTRAQTQAAPCTTHGTTTVKTVRTQSMTLGSRATTTKASGVIVRLDG